MRTANGHKWLSPAEATEFIDKWFFPTARIVEGDCWDWKKDSNGRDVYVQTYKGRPWFKRERETYQLHPAVLEMMNLYKPDRWDTLLLEWPHRSSTDPNRLAYTRDERAGEADRQVVTTIGKYLTRHFSHAPDNVIRDIVAQFSYDGGISIVDEINEMISAVVNGPHSCMSSSFDIRCDDGIRRHPYAVYDPSLGWSMAVRRDSDGLVLGRCLVYDHAEEGRVFVRSYKRDRNGGSYGSDEAIEAHLRNIGMNKRSGWPDGTAIMCYPARDGGYLMPYIDGDNHEVSLIGGDKMVIDSGGEITARNTCGVTEDADSTCEDCGRRFNSDDEGTWTGRYEDHHVCGNCADEYTYAYGRNGNLYYVHNDCVVCVDGEYYDEDFLSDNSIVQLHDHEYAHLDDTVYIGSVDAYYRSDDDDICYDAYNNQYELVCNCVTLRDGSMCHEDDAWQCTATDYWYTDGTDYVEIDGDKYHPDDAPETDDEADEADETESN
jgi:hypothetical protein